MLIKTKKETREIFRIKTEMLHRILNAYLIHSFLARPIQGGFSHNSNSIARNIGRGTEKKHGNFEA